MRSTFPVGGGRSPLALGHFTYATLQDSRMALVTVWPALVIPGCLRLADFFGFPGAVLSQVQFGMMD